MPNLGGGELLIILVILLLVFGGTQLPKLARSLGEARREFEKSQDEAAARAPLESSTPSTAADREAEIARREAEVARREEELRRQRDAGS